MSFRLNILFTSMAIVAISITVCESKPLDEISTASSTIKITTGTGMLTSNASVDELYNTTLSTSTFVTENDLTTMMTNSANVSDSEGQNDSLADLDDTSSIQMESVEDILASKYKVSNGSQVESEEAIQVVVSETTNSTNTTEDSVLEDESGSGSGGGGGIFSAIKEMFHALVTNSSDNSTLEAWTTDATGTEIQALMFM